MQCVPVIFITLFILQQQFLLILMFSRHLKAALKFFVYKSEIYLYKSLHVTASSV